MTEDSMTHDEEDAALAAEYVVGLIAADERASVEARMRQDRDFAARVAAWEAYFAGLNDDYGTAQPAPGIKVAIDRRLFGTADRKRLRWLPAGLVAAALAILVMVVSLPLLVPEGPRLTAELASGDSDYRFAVQIGEDQGEIDIALTAGVAVGDATFELWVIPSDGVPRSLGTFAQTAQLQQNGALSLQDGSVLAVSLEPLGGSPTGAPTGPVLAVGTLSDV
ncbi:anti-sigma factor [uncultured Tateyamaria sp.]|uniref:anti-sigma factor n=1 Tax=Tateyamaria sp. 1078 TaxID=3417464 RepID=UPI00260859ED|nr:anti-sigma factor [uncultured Tateyamaria sp.]